MAGATFKSEKEFQAWLARNPSAAARVPSERKATTTAEPALREAAGPISEWKIETLTGQAALDAHEKALRHMRQARPVALATSGGVAVTARLPARSRHPAPTLRQRFAVAMAWLFVVQVGLSTLGAFGCLCGILALEYVR